MLIELPAYVPMYEAMGCSGAPRLHLSNLAITGGVELARRAEWLTVIIPGGVCDMEVVAVYYGQLIRYLRVDQLGVELPDGYQAVPAST